MSGKLTGSCGSGANDGREALEMARRWCPDLIVLDLNLPDTDGFELSAALRGLPGGAAVPHCLLSADSTPRVQHRAREMGFARVWVKPLDARAMLLDIDALLPRQPGGRATEAPASRSLARHE